MKEKYNFVTVNKSMIEDVSFMKDINNQRIPFVIISILPPEYEKDELKIPFGDYCKDHLFVQFHDVNDDGSINSLKPVVKKITPMNENHAKEILDFTFKWKDKVKDFIIHCEAGMSRSPAIAVALSTILNDEPKWHNLYIKTLYNIKLHNNSVKNMILKTYDKFYKI